MLQNKEKRYFQASIKKIPVISKLSNSFEIKQESNHMVILEEKNDSLPTIICFCSKSYNLIPCEKIFPPLEVYLKKNGIEFEAYYESVGKSKFYVTYIFPSFLKFIEGEKIYPLIRIYHSYDKNLGFRVQYGIYDKNLKTEYLGVVTLNSFKQNFYGKDINGSILSIYLSISAFLESDFIKIWEGYETLNFSLGKKFYKEIISITESHPEISSDLIKGTYKILEKYQELDIEERTTYFHLYKAIVKVMRDKENSYTIDEKDAIDKIIFKQILKNKDENFDNTIEVNINSNK